VGIHNDRLAGLNARLQEKPLTVSGLEHVEVSAHVCGKESFAVERRFACTLQPNENHGFHGSISLSLRNLEDGHWVGSSNWIGSSEESNQLVASTGSQITIIEPQKLKAYFGKPGRRALGV
jgi:hypothetical protein